MTPIVPTPKGEITIRCATPEDATTLLDLRLESLNMQPEAFAADIDQTTADGAEAWVKLITDYANNHSGAVFLAVAKGELVGMAGLARGHWPKTGHFGTLWGVYVKPDWRGYKIGQAMVDGISEWAIKNQMILIYLGVTVSAQSAIRCYTRCGFIEYGIEPKVIFYNGIYYDQLLMFKLL